jgi:hypothetical protein
MSSPYPVTVGDEAFCLLTEIAGTASSSGDRKTLTGAARVRIAMIDGEVYECVILSASGGVAGHRITCQRADLYATHGREHAAFGDMVSRLWRRNGAPEPDGIGAREAAYLQRHDLLSARARWADDGGRV